MGDMRGILDAHCKLMRNGLGNDRINNRQGGGNPSSYALTNGKHYLDDSYGTEVDTTIHMKRAFLLMPFEGNQRRGHSKQGNTHALAI